MPTKKEPKGLDAKRQWYLYEQIRPFCPTTLQADYTCPKPTVPKPESDGNDTECLLTPTPTQKKETRHM